MLRDFNYSDFTIRVDEEMNSEKICYSIFDSTTFVGSIAIQIENQGFLDEIFIERQYRRKGLGKYLLNFFKIKKLKCTSWNEEAKQFYKTIGFFISESDIYLVTFERN